MFNSLDNTLIVEPSTKYNYIIIVVWNYQQVLLNKIDIFIWGGGEHILLGN